MFSLQEMAVRIKMSQRLEPLGMDRYHRLYWVFGEGVPGLYVEDGWRYDKPEHDRYLKFLIIHLFNYLSFIYLLVVYVLIYYLKFKCSFVKVFVCFYSFICVFNYYVCFFCIWVRP